MRLPGCWYIDAAGEFLARAGDEGDVGRVFLGAHPVLEAEAVGQRAMTGENNPLQPAGLGLRGVFGGRAVRVFAEGRVTVRFVEKR